MRGKRCSLVLILVLTLLLPRPLTAQVGEIVNDSSLLNALALGILLVVTIGWRLRRQVICGSDSNSALKVVTVKRISSKNALIVIDFNGKRQLLSCCDSGITVLADMQLDQGEENVAE